LPAASYPFLPAFFFVERTAGQHSIRIYKRMFWHRSTLPLSSLANHFFPAPIRTPSDLLPFGLDSDKFASLPFSFLFKKRYSALFPPPRNARRHSSPVQLYPYLFQFFFPVHRPPNSSYPPRFPASAELFVLNGFFINFSPYQQDPCMVPRWGAHPQMASAVVANPHDNAPSL